ncbi:creatininase family protein [Fodinicurvata sp. EGI_FJ10296]|uniref:creatininase family protein n=1 Tax=Fodinicurvata sp. EGI_FJ10296 TaxID=3231908 RepID=UPI003452FB91
MKWENLTSAEVGAVDRKTVVVLSIAAIEQHGPHLAVSTDAVIGGYLLDRLDEAVGDDILILPQIKVCCSEHHMDFAGTLSVSHETFLAYAGDMLTSVMRQGFRNIVILNSHGGNQAVGQVLVEKLGARHPDCRIAFMTWWQLAAPALRTIRESAFGGINHACEFETSLMLHTAPQAVRPDLITGMSRAPTFDWAEGDMLTGARGLIYRSMAEKSGGTGTVGDPSLGTAEKGQRIVDAVVAALTEVVTSLKAAPAKSGRNG